jgi:hypothetical protein
MILDDVLNSDSFNLSMNVSYDEKNFGMIFEIDS